MSLGGWSSVSRLRRGMRMRRGGGLVSECIQAAGVEVCPCRLITCCCWCYEGVRAVDDYKKAFTEVEARITAFNNNWPEKLKAVKTDDYTKMIRPETVQELVEGYAALVDERSNVELLFQGLTGE
eukprot:GHVU01098022.1.p2 GENE.GHVU01098022.1~~GHVU01098022.1.p2  ORF type:complete len:125 (+),score=12.07 GHVU01098022.1:825-1199(+)